MKKLILMLICVLATLSASAQTKLNWSVNLGLGASTWMGDGADGTDGRFSSKFGVGLDIPMTNLISFRTGLYYATKGATMDADFDIEGKSTTLDAKITQRYFQAPLLAAFHIGTGKNFDVVVSAGPYLAVGFGGKSQIEIDDLSIEWSTFKDSKINGQEFSQGLHRFDAGIQTGLDFDFPNWVVGADAEFGLAKLSSGDAPRNFAFFVNVGFKF